MGSKVTGSFNHVRNFFTRKWVWICLGGAVVIALLIGWTSDLSYEEPAEFTPASLDAEYRTNDLVTTFAYEDKRIIMSGTVMEKGQDAPTPLNQELPFLLLGESEWDDSSQVKCFFKADDFSQLDGVEPGDSISVEGTLLGNSLIPLMGSCEISD